MQGAKSRNKQLSALMRNTDKGTFYTTIYCQLRKTDGLKTCIFQIKTWKKSMCEILSINSYQNSQKLELWLKSEPLHCKTKTTNMKGFFLKVPQKHTFSALWKQSMFKSTVPSQILLSEGKCWHNTHLPRVLQPRSFCLCMELIKEDKAKPEDVWSL